MVMVHNLNGTSDNKVPSGYSSWKEWWEDKKGRKFPITCSRSGCYQTPTLGAHVQKKNGSDKWYIVPLCIACNNKSSKEEFDVREEDLQPVNS